MVGERSKGISPSLASRGFPEKTPLPSPSAQRPSPWPLQGAYIHQEGGSHRSFVTIHGQDRIYSASCLSAPSTWAAPLRPFPHSLRCPPSCHSSGPEAQWSVDFLCLTAAANPSLLRGSTLGNSEEVWDKVRGCWELAEADGGLQKGLPPQRLSLTLPTLL